MAFYIMNTIEEKNKEKIADNRNLTLLNDN